MRSARKIIKIILLSIMVIVAALFGYVLLLVSGVVYKGNASVYSVENSEVKADSPLKSKSILFLGSSVTHGVGFKGTSFVEYLEKIHGVNALKEALGGTTLVDLGKSSYIQRLKALDRSPKYDAFICQLSTNDATKKLPIGSVAPAGSDAYDTSTVAGAIEEVISYVTDTWHCPIIFYTGTRYDDDYYGEMVDLLLEIQKKWDIGVIDLWNDEELNDIAKEDYKLYMMNGIHPSMAGYKLWWLPAMEEYIISYLGLAKN